MQETRVRSLIREDLTSLWATKPTHHNYWSLCALQPGLCDKKPPQWEAHKSQLESGPYSLQLEKPIVATNIKHSQINNFFKCLPLFNFIQTPCRVYATTIINQTLNSVPAIILFHKFSSLSPYPQHLCLCSLFNLNHDFDLDLFTCRNPTLSLSFRLGCDFLHKASAWPF